MTADLPYYVTPDLAAAAPGEVDRWAFKVVHPDFRTRNDYRWPWPGNWAEPPEGSERGLFVAHTWYGAALSGIPAHTVLIVGYSTRDTIDDDVHKTELRRVWVADLVTPKHFATPGADFAQANLAGANLAGANLDRTNCAGAYFVGANLVGANLARANLARANLDRAVLPAGFKGGAA